MGPGQRADGARPTLLFLLAADCDRLRLQKPRAVSHRKGSFCMGLVVRRKKKPTVVAPRAVGAPFSTNHELTQSSREICFFRSNQTWKFLDNRSAVWSGMGGKQYFYYKDFVKNYASTSTERGVGGE